MPKTPDPQPISVVLAEDHTIVRQGLQALLSSQPDIRVVGQAADGQQAIEQARRLQPQVVVMDLALPLVNGVEATRQIVEACPDTRVLVLSMHSGEEYVRPAIRAGARGYIVKGAGLADLIAAIRAVAAGEAFFSPQVAKVLLQAATDQAAADDRPLSVREREVLRLVAAGKTSKEIAQLLHISPKTVEGHRGRIMEKLGLHDLAGLIRYAIRTGLAPVEPQK